MDYGIDSAKIITSICSVILCMAACPAMAEEEAVITPDELENYQFQQEPVEDNYIVNELGIGQRLILDTWRKEALNLIARHIGLRSLQGNSADLAVIQQIIDRDILAEDQIREWQYLGVVFGDILVTEFDLTWVSYEDDLGVSKALRWRKLCGGEIPTILFFRSRSSPNGYGSMKSPMPRKSTISWSLKSINSSCYHHRWLPQLDAVVRIVA